ncbi:MAG: ABC transporter ATP-binding protein [candidate division WOR-3 bacterium]
MPQNIIEVKNLSFGYNLSRVLHNLFCAFEEKKFFGIIGPNGAGKSTFLKIIAGILKNYEGEIIILGKSLREISSLQRARKIAFVSQETSFSLNYRVEDIVAMGRYPHTKPFQAFGPEDKKAIQEAIEYTAINKLQKRPILALSAGERQRVVIARALAQKPEILLLDEPTSHLDLHHQLIIMEILKKLSAQGITVIVVNHDLNLASLYCQHLILMNQGRIYAQGQPVEIIKREIIKEVYQTDVEIVMHPKKQIPQVLLR